MTSIARSVASLALVAVLTAACGAGTASTPAPTPTPAPTAMPVPSTPMPTPTPVPSTDGLGAEYVTGTGAAALTQPYTEKRVGDVTQVRDGIAVLTLAMNDPRVTGMATWDFDIDVYGTVGPEGLGPEWGPFRLENADGAWEGSCSGGAWHEGDGVVMSCWLVGGDAYEGSTFYLSLEKALAATAATVEGIIYPGPPPAP